MTNPKFKFYPEIRRRYEELLPVIIDKYPITIPYEIADWFLILTKAERMFWDCIRSLAAPFYPEFPVGKYYVDFADPFRKIAIEVHSNKYHLGREEKDFIRQSNIEDLGWSVYHLEAKHMWVVMDDFEKNDFGKEADNVSATRNHDLASKYLKYYSNDADGILRRFMYKHYSDIDRFSYLPGMSFPSVKKYTESL